MTASLFDRWAIWALISVILVDHGHAFTSQASIGRRNSLALPPITSQQSSLQATVNGESKTGDNDKGTTTTTASGQPGFPLHSLFNAAARAAVPKAADTVTNGHDAVSHCSFVAKEAGVIVVEIIWRNPSQVLSNMYSSVMNGDDGLMTATWQSFKNK